VNLSQLVSKLTVPLGAAAVVAATTGAVLCSTTTADAGTAAPTAGPAAQTAARAAAVTVADMMFGPASVSTTLGGSVTWTFQDTIAHTSTSDQGFWDSGTKSGGATYVRTFTSAGTFAYHCAIHTMMRGTVKVGLTTRGTPTKGFKLTWATAKGAGGITYDVQTRLGTGKWVSLEAATTATHAKLDPAKAGKYSVRARTGKGAAKSGWSPTVTVTIS
jgi:plastocyanin